MVAKIYIAARSAMQSAQKKNWILEYTQSKPFYIDPTMGWAGSSDVQQHIRLDI
ncbi:NADH-ubiquinone oxidoreductase subunit domain protein [Candidatus Cyrtobacter comes]|uniref:NADH-ubiquinone oxidoreductase subunit domain protein n=1 Tax=Candidatus Cyrtobacter comes TaxID=675776 RepID=A0ABU5L911_9RICK|nr:NADH-ubiquinone oxidoreductase subunit domain protein [Candidatus Cyrtobacter comes]